MKPHLDRLQAEEGAELHQSLRSLVDAIRISRWDFVSFGVEKCAQIVCKGLT